MTSSNRFLSLDVFRGITICFMIIVNTPGTGAAPFAPLMHAPWNGFTPTDLVFPSFLFAVGNAMSFSQRRFADLPQSTVLLKIFKRTCLIFAIGFLIYWFPFFKTGPDGIMHAFPISETRIMGVLQRIALCYGLASLLIYYFSSKKVIIISFALLAAYWIILLLFGDAHNQFSVEGNACLYLDQFLFNEKHLYHEAGVVFDPEGILGTLSAVLNVIIGYFAGKFIREKGKGYESIAKLMIVAAVFIFTALCWNGIYPINKNLWTGSFVLLTTGIDLAIIGILIYATEISKHLGGEWTDFFVVFGKNPLFIYVASVLIRIVMNRVHTDQHTTVYEWFNQAFFQPVAPGPAGSLLFSLSFVVFCWGIVWYMDKRSLYIRV